MPPVDVTVSQPTPPPLQPPGRHRPCTDLCHATPAAMFQMFAFSVQLTVYRLQKIQN